MKIFLFKDPRIIKFEYNDDFVQMYIDIEIKDDYCWAFNFSHMRQM